MADLRDAQGIREDHRAIIARLNEVEECATVQERKISPKRKFSGRISRGHPGVIRADVPTQNFGQGPRNPGKTSIWVRTSMTRRRGRPRPQGIFKNFGQKNFGLKFRPLTVHTLREFMSKIRRLEAMFTGEDGVR